MGNIIVVKNLFKKFGNIIALDKFNAVFPRGVSGLIGPNGSGKTTFINILAGLVKPDSGKVEVLGLDSTENNLLIREKVGFLLEEMHYPSNLTVEKYLKYVARLKRTSFKEIKEISREIGLLEYFNRKIKTLSAGMYKMLGLTQALAGNPELVVLDEPVSNLDPLRRIRLLNYIVKISKEKNTSFLISSHVLPELEEICEWIVLIHKGKRIDSGTLSDLYSKYSTEFYEVMADNVHVLYDYIREHNLGEVVEVSKSKVKVRIKNYSEFNKMLANISDKVKIFYIKPAGGLKEVFKNAVEKSKY